ncbi:MAG: hypothetical protein WC279_11125 [Sulfurimonas sp.]|jgi:GR25 family glycosyltransferase involved in LPS biosynthesis|uniref:hypothetical protein n=1 Tax=Sulfurimonas sp. TaxID=2022749 RepID=UPI003564D536
MTRVTVLTTPGSLSRYCTTSEILTSAGINHKVFPAVQVSEPKAGRLRKAEVSQKVSFAGITRKARQENAPSVLILEDDIYLPEGFDNSGLTAVLEELPEDFGIALLGCYFKPGSTGKFYRYSDHILEMQKAAGKILFTFWGCHAVLVNSTLYDTIIDLLEDPSTPVTDRALCDFIVPHHRCFLMKPPLIFQRHSSGSDHGSIHGKFRFKEMELESLEYIRKNTV